MGVRINGGGSWHRLTHLTMGKTGVNGEEGRNHSNIQNTKTA